MALRLHILPGMRRHCMCWRLFCTRDWAVDVDFTFTAPLRSLCRGLLCQDLPATPHFSWPKRSDIPSYLEQKRENQSGCGRVSNRLSLLETAA